MHATLLALAVFALLLYAVGVHGWVREVGSMVVLTLLPGFAILSLLPRVNPLMRFGVGATLSLAVCTLLAGLLVAVSAFKPAIVIWTLFPASALLLWWRDFTRGGDAWAQRHKRRIDASAVRQDPHSIDRSLSFAAARVRSSARLIWLSARATRANQLALGALFVALILWLLAAHSVDVTKMSDFGLISVLPITWPVAMAIVLVTVAIYSVSARPDAWVMLALIAGLIVMIYATAPLVYDAPHLPWVYKHVGVVNLLLEHGHALRDVDIYNRWPSFFALGGVFTRFSGAPGPVHFVQWAELYFICLQTALVGAMMWNETKRVAPTGLAAMLFVLINWIGQAYFSPQALAFTLMLGLLTLAFSQLYDDGNRIGGWLKSLTGFIVRRRQQWAATASRPDLSVRTTVLLVLLLDAGIAVAHQLTPYVLLIQLGILTFCGFVKPRWLWFACAGVTAAYLLPNLAWVNDHYGLFSSLDPFNNAKVADTTQFACSSACRFVSRISTLASAFSWLAGTVAILIIARRRPTFRLPLYGLSMFGAFVMIFGQSYGGEAALRVVMFSAPFAAILIAAAIETFPLRLRSVMAVGMACVMAFFFVYAYFGNEEFYYVTEDSVRSSEYLYAHAPAGAPILYTAENFPGLLAGNYNEFGYSNFSGGNGLFDDTRLRDRALGPAQVQYVIEDLEGPTGTGFVTFSPQMDNYAVKKGMTKAGQLENLRAAMLASGRFEVWYHRGGTEIFRLLPEAGTTAPG